MATIETGTVRHVTKDGLEVLIDTRWTLVRDDQGRPGGKLVVSTDVTERRRLEAQILRTQRLESIGVLAGGIAHDFNNLLTPMLLAVKLLREDRPPETRERLPTALQVGAGRGAESVGKLLSFAGGGGGERGPVDVAAAVPEIEATAAHTFPKSIRLDVRLAAGGRAGYFSRRSVPSLAAGASLCFEYDDHRFSPSGTACLTSWLRF